MRGMTGNRPGMGGPDGRSRASSGRARTPDGCGCAADGRARTEERYSRAEESCACTKDGYASAADVSDIPAGSCQQLLQYLDEVSFCAYDLMLYLDTHPDDENARQAFHEYSHKRKHALHLYEEKYGPMRYGHGGPGAPYSAKWVSQAWPWEGGEN